MRSILLAVLLLPATAWAHGQYTEAAPDVSTGWSEPTVAEIEDAILAAAGEFFVPESLLRAVAHTEGRWQHLPYRISSHGRRGLFSLTADRIDDAAAILGEDVDAIRGDYWTHTRAFACLLDDARPLTAPLPPVGEWRDALAWSMDLAPGAADQYADRVMGIVNDGVSEQLPTTGEPITIAPEAVDGQYMGLFEGMVERSSDYAGAVWNPAASCNYSNSSRGIGDVDKIIIHTAQGTYAGTISWFQNCAASVSTHYVVSTQGDVTQMVEEEDVGWHVSCWNGRSIGIEHEGYVSQPSVYYTTAMYSGSAALVADILSSWNLPVDRNSVMGHVEIDPACNGNSHSDPGTGWDWDLFMSLLGTTNPPDPTNLVGVIRHTDLSEPAYSISGATVSAPGLGSTTTSATGLYEFNDITPDTYTICADATGYQQGCTTKVVAPEITNWGSILLSAVVADDDDAVDDDDTSVDDDDTSVDDDDTSVDDDDTSVDDDDTSVDDDDTSVDDDDTSVDDDDTSIDDDDTSIDDDDTSLDDDDTSLDDDDTSVDDDDATPEPSDEGPVYGGVRHSVLADSDGGGSRRGGCNNCSAAGGAAGLPGLFLILGLRRRRT